ncbi:hypothetical protein ACR30T_00235 [Neisseria gonorrhoeae]
MTVRIKGVTVELNGADYVIPPIALGALEQLQERIGSFDGNAADAGQISTVIDCAHAALKRNYPDLTREEAADLIDIGNMNEVFAAVMDVSGLKRKEQEAAQAGRPGRRIKFRRGDCPRLRLYRLDVGLRRRQLGFAAYQTPERVLARTSARAYLGSVVYGRQAVVGQCAKRSGRSRSRRYAWRRRTVRRRI